MEHKVTITPQAYDAILKLPFDGLNDSFKKEIRVGDLLTIDGLSRRLDDNIKFLKLRYKTTGFYLRAELFDFDVEAFEEELKEENRKRELERLAEKHEQERKEILEHYDWNDLRCKAAVAAMQGFLSNGLSDEGSPDATLKLLVSTSVKVATTLVEELKATV